MREVIVTATKQRLGRIFAGLLLLGLVLFIVYVKFSPCSTFQTIETVQGGSLSGVVENGEQVRAIHNYYYCHPVARGDLVLYQYAGDSHPLVKIVKGMPGDTFMIEQGSSTSDILINGERLTNASGQVYQLNKAAAALLLLYVNDYHGMVPADSYLIFGNIPTGSLDSSHFGLVAKQDFIGKAEALEN